MKFLKLATLIGIGFAAFTALSVDAQNLQSVSRRHNNAHEDLLASQQGISGMIKNEATAAYMDNIFKEETEPELDIYEEGWESNRVNSYKNAIVPNKKVIDVRNFCMPTPGYVTSPYGYRPRFHRMHKGIDLKIQIGDTIRAAFDGKIRLTKYEGRGYGYYVIVRHENGLETVYGHLSRFLVRPDQYVHAGQPIALGGNTGRSTGPHLHFETRFMGYAINPAAIFDFRNQTTHTDYYTFSKRTYEDARDYSPNAEKAKYEASNSSNKYKAKSSNSGSSYKIRKGDTLGKIASRNGMSVKELCNLNGMTKSSTLRPGSVLKVK